MSITYRLRDVSPAAEVRLTEAFESALDGNWCVTVSRSHLDGQWHLQLQLQGGAEQWTVVLPSFDEVALTQLSEMLRQLAPAAGRPEVVTKTPAYEKARGRRAANVA